MVKKLRPLKVDTSKPKQATYQRKINITPCNTMNFKHRDTGKTLTFHSNRNALTSLEKRNVLTLSNYCNENGLDRQAMYKVYKDERQHHKGWIKA